MEAGSMREDLSGYSKPLWTTKRFIQIGGERSIAGTRYILQQAADRLAEYVGSSPQADEGTVALIKQLDLLRRDIMER